MYKKKSVVQSSSVLQKFRSGGFNTVVSTSVGEEGLDIGDVDLIVCFDASSSPIRLVQRMGRTGRKRDGKIIILVGEGKEETIYKRSLSNKKGIHKNLTGATQSLALYDNNHRMIPRHLNPCCVKTNIVTVAYRPNVRQSAKITANTSTRTSPLLNAHETQYLQENFQGPVDGCKNCKRLQGRGKYCSHVTVKTLSLCAWKAWQEELLPCAKVPHSTRSCNFCTLMQFSLQDKENIRRYQHQKAKMLRNSDIKSTSSLNNRVTLGQLWRKAQINSAVDSNSESDADDFEVDSKIDNVMKKKLRDEIFGITSAAAEHKFKPMSFESMLEKSAESKNKKSRLRLMKLPRVETKEIAKDKKILDNQVDFCSQITMPTLFNRCQAKRRDSDLRLILDEEKEENSSEAPETLLPGKTETFLASAKFKEPPKVINTNFKTAVNKCPPVSGTTSKFICNEEKLSTKKKFNPPFKAPSKTCLVKHLVNQTSKTTKQPKTFETPENLDFENFTMKNNDSNCENNSNKNDNEQNLSFSINVENSDIFTIVKKKLCGEFEMNDTLLDCFVDKEEAQNSSPPMLSQFHNAKTDEKSAQKEKIYMNEESENKNIKNETTSNDIFKNETTSNDIFKNEATSNDIFVFSEDSVEDSPVFRKRREVRKHVLEIAEETQKAAEETQKATEDLDNNAAEDLKNKAAEDLENKAAEASPVAVVIQKKRQTGKRKRTSKSKDENNSGSHIPAKKMAIQPLKKRYKNEFIAYEADATCDESSLLNDTIIDNYVMDSFIDDATQVTPVVVKKKKKGSKEKLSPDMNLIYKQSLISPTNLNIKFRTPAFHVGKSRYKLAGNPFREEVSEDEAEEVMGIVEDVGDSDHGSDHHSDHGSDHHSDHGSDHHSDHGSDHHSDHGSDHHSDHGSDHHSDHGSDHHSDHGSDHHSDHGSDHHSDHGSDHHSDHGSDHHSDHGSDHHSDHGSDHHSDHGSDHHSDHGSDHHSDHGSDHHSDHGSDHHSDHGSDHHSDHGSDHHSDHGSDHHSDHGSDHHSDHGSDHHSDHGSDHHSDHGSDHHSHHGSDGEECPTNNQKKENFRLLDDSYSDEENIKEKGDQVNHYRQETISCIEKIFLDTENVSNGDDKNFGATKNKRCISLKTDRLEIECSRSLSKAKRWSNIAKNKMSKQEIICNNKTPKLSYEERNEGKSPIILYREEDLPPATFSFGLDWFNDKQVIDTTIPTQPLINDRDYKDNTTEPCDDKSPLVLIDSRCVANSQIPSLLRAKEKCRTEVVSQLNADYVISRRLAVNKRTSIDLSNIGAARRLLDQANSTFTSYEKQILILEKPRSKNKTITSPKRSDCNKCSAGIISKLIEMNVKILQSESQEETSCILYRLAKCETEEGFSISLPHGREKMVRTLLSVPNVTYPIACEICTNIPSLHHLIQCGLEQLQTTLDFLQPQRAAEIYFFFRCQFSIAMLGSKKTCVK